MLSGFLVFINLILLVYSSQTSFYGNNTIGPYKISDKVIFAGTDSVFVNDSLISRDDYSIDYNQSLVTFHETIAESIMVLVKYRQVPFSANQRYYKQVLIKIDSGDTLIKEEKKMINSMNIQSDGDLELIGSKTISIDVGSKQGLGLDQATRIDIKGNLQGVDISAMLSDIGNPIPPEGTTKELSEFDKIQIKVEGEKFKGYYGDIDYNQSLGSIGMINKKLTGILFDAYLGKSVNKLSYAKSKGIYKRLLFYGQNNKQGPYYLTKDLKDAAVVPGTENVYLMGKRLVRGQDEDYTIDYGTGSVSFTNRNIINSFARIEIDFEYTTDEYNRYLILANNEWQLKDGFSFGGGLISEADDKSRNLSYDLSDDDIEYLSTVSSESSSVWLSGVKFTGAGNGDYILENNYFVFSRIDSGDYDVRFSYVGANLGDYDYDNSIAGFRYVGANQGKYITKIRIQLPAQNRIYNANLVWQTPLRINFALQGYWSQRKQNLFSQHGFNNGFGYHISSVYQQDKFKIKYSRDEAEQRFYFPYSFKETDFEYNWLGVKQESLRHKDEIEMEIKPFNFVLLNGGAGWLNTFNNIKHKHFFYGGKIIGNTDYSLLEWKITHYPKIENRYYLNLTPQYKLLYPGFEFYWQNQHDSLQRYFIPSLRIKYNDEIDLMLTSDIKEINEQMSKKNQTHKIATNLTKDNLNLNVVIGYQINTSNNIKENADWFSNLTSNIRLIKGFDLSFDYLQQQGEMQTMELNYVWVGQGLGDYKQNPETNQYYFDLNGDYVQQLIPSGNFVINNFRKLQAVWDFYKWSLVNFDGYYSINFENRGQATYANTKNNRFLNISVLPYEKTFSIKINNYYDFSKDDQYLAFASARKNNNNRIELSSQRLEEMPLVFSYEHNNQITEILNQAVDERRTDVIYSLKPKVGFNLNFEVNIIHARALIAKPLNYNQLGEFRLYKWELVLSKNWQISKWSNLHTNVSLAQRTASIDQLPYDINLYEPKGVTPQAKIGFDRIFDSSALNQIMFTAFYSFLKYSSRSTENNFSAKIQVNF